MLSEDGFLGCIMGLAVGDAIGFQTEALKLSAIKQQFGPQGVTGMTDPPALYSDDTQMSLCIARSLIEAGDKDLESFMQVVSREFVAWYRSPECCRGPGMTCLTGCANLERGVHWTRSGVPGSKGCGGAMRSAPVGLFFYDDEEKLIETAKATCIATHGHPTGIAATVGTAFLTALALNGEAPRTWLDRLVQATADIDGDFVAWVSRVPDALRMEDEEEALEYLGRGWTGEETVALALYCVLLDPGDLRRTVLRAANSNGDSDSIACISGAISGAYNGAGTIPGEWLHNVETPDLLRDTAGKLYAAHENAASRRKEG